MNNVDFLAIINYPKENLDNILRIFKKFNLKYIEEYSAVLSEADTIIICNNEEYSKGNFWLVRRNKIINFEKRSHIKKIKYISEKHLEEFFIKNFYNKKKVILSL